MLLAKYKKIDYIKGINILISNEIFHKTMI